MNRRNNEAEALFSEEDLDKSLKRVELIDFHQTIDVDGIKVSLQTISTILIWFPTHFLSNMCLNYLNRPLSIHCRIIFVTNSPNLLSTIDHGLHGGPRARSGHVSSGD